MNPARLITAVLLIGKLLFVQNLVYAEPTEESKKDRTEDQSSEKEDEDQQEGREDDKSDRSSSR